MTHSHLEWTLAHQITADGLPEPGREFMFDPTRKWRADFAWPDYKLLVEVEGGTWSKGKYVRPIGYEQNCEKCNAAALLGWTVLRFTSNMIMDGRAVRVIKEALAVTEHGMKAITKKHLRAIRLFKAQERGLITAQEFLREMAALEGREPLPEQEEQ